MATLHFLVIEADPTGHDLSIYRRCTKRLKTAYQKNQLKYEEILEKSHHPTLCDQRENSALDSTRGVPMAV